MIRPPLRSTLTDTLFPSTPLFRSALRRCRRHSPPRGPAARAPPVRARSAAAAYWLPATLSTGCPRSAAPSAGNPMSRGGSRRPSDELIPAGGQAELSGIGKFPGTGQHLLLGGVEIGRAHV